MCKGGIVLRKLFKLLFPALAAAVLLCLSACGTVEQTGKQIVNHAEDSRYATANANAKAAYTAAESFVINMEIAGTPTKDSLEFVNKTISGSTPYSGSHAKDCTAEGLRASVGEDIGISTAAGEFSVKFGGSGEIICAWWRAADSTEIVGRYPEPSSEDSPAEWGIAP